MLLLAATASSSLVQPLFGLLSDRRGALWLIPGGTLLSAIGVGGAAIAPAYPVVLLQDSA
jgi:FSR family fosmidomycin resistance protein-like MFS transporter